MMGQKVAAEVAKAQLLHSKGGALSKTTTCVSWINQHYPEKKNWIQHNTTNSHQALVRTFFAHHYEWKAIQPWHFSVYKFAIAHH